ncbi:hypothetical protein [Treponema zioleckii]|uniref:hypothetical protein n=1 Tax=Treponema zioleckii TaxID=331680 RepID=UPI00168BB2B7|nr:hypothetical protein [Treponema zioleckii]
MTLTISCSDDSNAISIDDFNDDWIVGTWLGSYTESRNGQLSIETFRAEISGSEDDSTVLFTGNYINKESFEYEENLRDFKQDVKRYLLDFYTKEDEKTYFERPKITGSNKLYITRDKTELMAYQSIEEKTTFIELKFSMQKLTFRDEHY